MRTRGISIRHALTLACAKCGRCTDHILHAALRDAFLHLRGRLDTGDSKTTDFESPAMPASELRQCGFPIHVLYRASYPIQEGRISRTFSYCRVSTTGQTTENQVREIAAAGFVVEPKRIIAETVSGSVPAFQRREFARLADRLEAGDRIICTKLDRLGRNAMDVRATIEKLASQGIHVHCLALGGVDLTSAAGRMTMAIIAAVGEFEKDQLVERTLSGLRRAVAEGKALGRPPALNPQQQEQVRQRRREGVSLGMLAKEHGVSRAAIQRIEKRGH